MIGIICAETEELNAVTNLMQSKSEEKYSAFNFFVGKINGVVCAAVLSGVGKVNAAMCTQTLILKYAPEIVLNIGVAGALSDNIKIGDIVIAFSVVQHDFDVSAFANRQKGEVPGIGLVKIPCTKLVTNKIISSSKEINGLKIHTGTIATGDQFIGCLKKRLKIKNDFDAIACDMESASIGQTCFINNIDFGVIRSISDSACENSNIDFPDFIKSSALNAAKILDTFTKHIKQ